VDVVTDPRRTLTKGQRTRDRLLRAAIERFGAEGYRSTSVSQLSRDAGLTPAAAYAYFEDKEAFWVAAVNADLDSLDAEIRERALAAESPLLELMANLVNGLQLHPLTRRVMIEGSSADLQLVIGHRLFAGTKVVIADRLRARQAAGIITADVDPMVLATGIETVMFSLVLSTVRAGLENDPERIRAVVAILRSAVGGPPTVEERRI
jgi:AcrR family transcriptional regulator